MISMLYMENNVKIENFRFSLDHINMVGTCYGVADKRKKYNTLTIPGYVVYKDKTYKIVSIDVGGFNGCKVESVILPNTITYLRINSFSGCYNLRYVNIPKSVKTIDHNCFSYCDNLVDVEFEGDVNDIDIKPYAFYGSGIVNKNFKKDPDCYFGNILYQSLSKNVLKIKSGTTAVILKECTATDIIFPESVKFISIMNAIYLERVYFSNIEHFLEIKFEVPLLNPKKLIDLYFNGKLEKYIKLPRTVRRLNNAFSGSSIKNIILNTNISSISYGCFKYCYDLDNSSIYIPKNMDFNYFAADYLNVNEVRLNFSTFKNKYLKFSYFNKIRKLVIYLDDLSFFNGLISIDTVILEKIKLVITSNINNNKLEIFISNLIDILDTSICNTKLELVGKEFLNLSKKFILKNRLKFTIEVDDYLIPYYKDSIVWENFDIISREKDDLKYNIVNEKTCEVTYKLDPEGNNSYSGILRIPKMKEIDGKLYKVIGIDDFAFSDCHGLEEVILEKDQELNDLSLFNCPYVKVTKL